jgi:hypothetical protein
MFEALEFVYLPSRDVAADLNTSPIGWARKLVFALEAFGTRVAMVRLSPDLPVLVPKAHSWMSRSRQRCAVEGGLRTGTCSSRSSGITMFV